MGDAQMKPIWRKTGKTLVVLPDGRVIDRLQIRCVNLPWKIKDGELEPDYLDRRQTKMAARIQVNRSTVTGWASLKGDVFFFHHNRQRMTRGSTARRTPPDVCCFARG
ncbi:MAG: hypothetical protein WC518_04005 [Patescibacteria group bacterium]